MGDRSEPVRKYDVQRWNDAWERIRANQARAQDEPTLEPSPPAVEPSVQLTEQQARDLGERLWYQVTDDDCRLRASSPQSMASYLSRILFPNT